MDAPHSYDETTDTFELDGDTSKLNNIPSETPGFTLWMDGYEVVGVRIEGFTDFTDYMALRDGAGTELFNLVLEAQSELIAA